MKFEGKIVFTITDQSKIDPYSDFELWETLTVTFERLKRSPLGAAHAVGQIYEVPPPGCVMWVCVSVSVYLCRVAIEL